MNLPELKKLAESATKDWKVVPILPDSVASRDSIYKSSPDICFSPSKYDKLNAQSIINWAFVNAANPQTVLEMIGVIEEYVDDLSNAWKDYKKLEAAIKVLRDGLQGMECSCVDINDHVDDCAQVKAGKTLTKAAAILKGE